MSRFRFRTTFTTTAAPEPAFRTIVVPELWLDAWRHALTVARTEPGAPDGRGARFRARVRGPAGYALGAELEVTSTAPPRAASMRLSGDLEGVATWQLEPSPSGTAVVLVLDVVATQPWMVALAPVAGPLFVWSHGRVVRHAVEAAVSSIGERLLTFESGAETPPR